MIHLFTLVAMAFLAQPDDIPEDTPVTEINLEIGSVRLTENTVVFYHQLKVDVKTLKFKDVVNWRVKSILIENGEVTKIVFEERGKKPLDIPGDAELLPPPREDK